MTGDYVWGDFAKGNLATTHIESEYKVATLSDMRPTHTALRLRDMDTASRRQS